MRQSILIIGEDLEINREFLNYIFQSYEDHFGELGVVSFAPKNSKELPFIIDINRAAEKIYQKITTL